MLPSPRPENRKNVDQTRERLHAFLENNAATLAANGTVVESWRSVRGRRCGPYYRIAYRCESRQRSYYLGADGRLADEARTAVARLQESRRLGRLLEKQRRVIQRHVRRSRRAWDAELRGTGLYLHGSEVRGWRDARQRLRPANPELGAARRPIRATEEDYATAPD